MKKYVLASCFSAVLALSLTGCGGAGSIAQPEVPAFTQNQTTSFADVKSRLAATSDNERAPIQDISQRLTQEEGRTVSFYRNMISVQLPQAEKQVATKVLTYPLPAGLSAKQTDKHSLQQAMAQRIDEHMELIYDAFIGQPFPGVHTKDEARSYMVVQQIYSGSQPVAYVVRTGFLNPDVAPDPDSYEAAYSLQGKLLYCRETVRE